MLAELVVMIIILIITINAYLKSSVLRTFLLLISSMIAAVIAFSYFEKLGQLIINLLVEWSFAVSLMVIFFFSVLILHTIGSKIITIDIYFGDLADRVIRSLLAVFAGLIFAGIILIAVAMMPIGTKWPYERFTSTASNPPEPEKILILNADGFVTSISSWISRGSMSGKKSFAVFHPSFIDEIHLNRLGTDIENSTVAKSSSAITIEEAKLSQTELVSSTDKQPLIMSSNTKAVIIKTRLSDAFSMSQLRLICKKSNTANNLKGTGKVIWPVGYLSGENAVTIRNLPDKLSARQAELVFYMPTDMTPIMLQFKQNAVAPISRLTTGN